MIQAESFEHLIVTGIVIELFDGGEVEGNEESSLFRKNEFLFDLTLESAFANLTEYFIALTTLSVTSESDK